MNDPLACLAAQRDELVCRFRKSAEQMSETACELNRYADDLENFDLEAYAMNRATEIVRRLLERDTQSSTQLSALTAERDGLQRQVTDLEGQVAAGNENAVEAAVLDEAEQRVGTGGTPTPSPETPAEPAPEIAPANG